MRLPSLLASVASLSEGPFGRAPRLLVGVSALLAFACPACSEDEAPGCVPLVEPTLPPTPLSLTTDVRIDRAGSGFVLFGRTGETLRWGRVDAAGVAEPETTITLPPRLIGPYYAAVGKAAPADELVVVYGAAKPGGASGQLALFAIHQPAGGAASAPEPLVDLPSGTDEKSFQGSLLTGKAGRRAGFAWGVSGAKPSFLLLRPAGEPVASPTKLSDLPDTFRCLALAPVATRPSDAKPAPGEFFVSLLSDRTDNVDWAFSELREEGSVSYSVQRLPLNRTDVPCPTVGPSQAGYAFSWSTLDGLFFGEYDLSTNASDPSLIAGAVRFGGPTHVPPVAALAGVGKDFALLLQRDDGPEVWRVDVFAHRIGAATPLAVSGKAGPVSGTVDATGESLVATYLDQPRGSPSAADGGTAGATRRFVRLGCAESR